MKAYEIKGFKNYGQMLKMLKSGVPNKKKTPEELGFQRVLTTPQDKE